MAVSVIKEEVHPEAEAPAPRLKLVAPPEAPAPAPPLEDLFRPEADPLPSRKGPRQPVQWPAKEMVAVLSAIALIISVRLSLILGFLATASLFWVAATAPTVGSIVAAGLFAVLVFWPLSWLALKKG